MENKKSFVVIGLGLFGTQTATKLYELGKDVLAIDTDEDIINEIAGRVGRAVVADATKKDVLKQLGVDKYDCVIVGTATDLATSVLVTVNLKALGVKEIICKATNETNKEVLETLGATKVIIPERLTADRLCKKLVQPNVLEYIEVSEKYKIIEMELPKSWAGKSIIELNIRAKYGVNVMAIKRGEELEVTFDPSEELKESDVIVMIGAKDSLNKIQDIK